MAERVGCIILPTAAILEAVKAGQSAVTLTIVGKVPADAEVTEAAKDGDGVRLYFKSAEDGPETVTMKLSGLSGVTSAPRAMSREEAGDGEHRPTGRVRG